MKKIKTWSLIGLTILSSSCGNQTTYRPLLLAHDYKNMELVRPKKAGRVYCGDKEFNEYVSFHVDDLADIALVLKHAKVPWWVRQIIEKKTGMKFKEFKRQFNELPSSVY